MQHRFFQAAFAALLAAGTAAGQSDPHAEKLCGEANRIVDSLTTISDMARRHAVPCDFISKAKINEFLHKRIKETVKPEEIRSEELTLKKFGLVPPDYDLAKNTIDLLTEQAAAFYDYDRKKLFITETTPADTQDPVLAHELSHALADQNFNLGKFIRQGRKSDDGATARLAVMEGQATWLMAEYLARKLGKSLKDSPEMVTMMSAMSEGGGQFPVFDNAPLYLRQTLIFPYTKGMLFQNAVFQHDGAAGFAEVFRKPPVSTQQILHPELYFAQVKPADPSLPEPKLRGYKGLIGGSLGELEHSILIEQAAGKERAAELSPHWRGSNFLLMENKGAARVVLLYVAEWDTENAARDYFAVYRQAMARKWHGMRVSAETTDSVTGTGDDGRFELRLKGKQITSVEGLSE